MSDDIDEIMMLLNSMPSGINKENPAEEALPEKNAPRKIAKMIEARPFVDLAFLFVKDVNGMLLRVRVRLVPKFSEL